MVLGTFGLLGGAPTMAQPASKTAFLYLRPTRDRAFKNTQLDRIAEAQRLRVSAQNALEQVSGRTVLSHEELRTALGNGYLVELFECKGDGRCIVKRASALRSLEIQSVVVGEYSVDGSEYRVQLQRLDLTGAPGDKVTFEVQGVELETPQAWQQPLAPWFSLTGTIRVRTNIADGRCTLDGKPCAADAAGRIVAVKRGEHIVSIEKEGFHGGTQSVTVNPGVEIDLMVRLEPVAAPASEPPGDAGTPAGLETAHEVLNGTDHAPPTGRVYRAVEATLAPVIDGNLDERVWAEAPRDARFVSRVSQPRGGPTTAPTEFQMAFDQQNLYVAVRSKDAPGISPENETAAPALEWSIVDFEKICVFIDAEHDHSTLRVFCTSRGGYRADAEVSSTQEAGRNWQFNLAWRGIWSTAVGSVPAGWNVEFQIPWGTLRLRPQDEPFVIGVNLERRVPTVSEMSEWSLSPAAFPMAKPSHFGHLEIPAPVQPGQRLYVAPFLSGLVDGNSMRSPLRGFVNVPGAFAIYGGFDARVRPWGPLQVDLTVNPDFISAVPDSLVSPLNRFELFYPENRDFFIESPTYQFGTAENLLFYSRRVGLGPGANGKEAPILYGLNARIRQGGFEVGALNVSTSTEDRVRLAENISVVRGQNYFAGANRVGAIVLNSAEIGVPSRYRAYGIDGAVSWYEGHLHLAGAAVRTDVLDGTAGYFGQGEFSWTSDSFDARAAYAFVDRNFDARLGYFPIVGVHKTALESTYKINLFSDWVQQLSFNINMSKKIDLAGQTIVDTKGGTIHALFNAWATFDLYVTQNTDRVLNGFSLASKRLSIAAGTYDSLVTGAKFSSQSGPLSFALDYAEGAFFGGYRRSSSLSLGVRIRKFNGKALYQLNQVQLAGQPELAGHRVNGVVSYAYLPSLRSMLSIDVNTFDIGSVGQFTTAWSFGQLSSVSLVISSRFLNQDQTVTLANTSAVIKFTYGLSLF